MNLPDDAHFREAGPAHQYYTPNDEQTIDLTVGITDSHAEGATINSLKAEIDRSQHTSTSRYCV